MKNTEHEITCLVQKILPTADATANVNRADRSSGNYKFVNAIAHENAYMTVKEGLDKRPVLREMAQKGEIMLVGAMLDVETRKAYLH